MQGSDVTEPVKFLANKTPLLVISSQSLSEKSYFQYHCARFSCVVFIFTAIFDFFELLLLYAARGSTTLWQCYDVILSSIRRQTIKNWRQFVNYSTWKQFGHVTLYFERSSPVPTVWARTPGNYFIASSRVLKGCEKVKGCLFLKAHELELESLTSVKNYVLSHVRA